MEEHITTFSVLGDSISTFQGFTPPGGVYYAPSSGPVTGVHSVEDTWWMQVIRGLGGRLLANNSWSGSTVTSPGRMPACSEGRIRKLAPDGQVPDHILVLSGLNDVNMYLPPEQFGKSYALMLENIRTHYPKAKVTCGTLITGYLSQSPFRAFFYFQERLGAYNEQINKAVRGAGYEVADLAALKEQYPSMDGLHPNGEGMKKLAELWLRSVGVRTL